VQFIASFFSYIAINYRAYGLTYRVSWEYFAYQSVLERTNIIGVFSQSCMEGTPAKEKAALRAAKDKIFSSVFELIHSRKKRACGEPFF